MLIITHILSFFYFVSISFSFYSYCQNVVCFEPEGGFQMTVNLDGTVTGQNGRNWMVGTVIF